MKLLAALVFAAVCAATAVMTYPLWYGPLTGRVPQLERYLPPLATQSAAAAGAPNATPIPMQPVLHTTTANEVPSATPLFTPPVATSPLSSDDCRWAISIMQEDANLDRMAESEYPDEATYYANYSADWTMIANELSNYVCARPPLRLSQDNITQALDWLRQGLANHENALAQGKDIDWNTKWAGNYQRLIALLDRVAAAW